MQEKTQLCKQYLALFLGSNGATASSYVWFRVSGPGKIELQEWMGICISLGGCNMILTFQNNIGENVAVKWLSWGVSALW